MQTQENPDSQKSLEKGEQSWKNHILSHQTLLQSCSDQNIMVLAKKKKKRHINPWNRIDSPEISSCTYGQWIYNKGRKNI